MRAEANETKASWTGPSRSVRNRRPAKAVQPRQGPLRHPAIDPQATAVLRSDAARRWGFRSPAPPTPGDAAVSRRLGSAYRLSGTRRGRSALRRTGGMSSTSGSSSLTSGTLAPVLWVTSGTPWPSVRTWCLVPGWPRSVGLGPVLIAAPQGSGLGTIDLRRGTNRACRPARARPRGSGATSPRPRPAARH